MDSDGKQSQPQKLGFYEVESLIGHGGMASVFRGRQPSLNRTVAIKILPPQFASSPDLISRFQREGEIIGQLNHPNIAQVIDRGQEDDTLYIVMEYVDGKSLDQLMRQGQLTVDQVIDYALQICEGLDYAHLHGVTHRDLKPSNILVEHESNRIRIADFGIAQFETNANTLATLTSASGSLGTINYMSPEQRLDSHRVDHRTDIFSFGVILYEMLTGRLPLGHFKLPSFLRPDVPILIDGIIKRCLAEAPADRYQSAGEIRENLRMLTRRQSRVASSPTGFLVRLSKRQRMGLTTALAAAAVLFIAVVAILALANPPSRQSTSERPASTINPPELAAASPLSGEIFAPPAPHEAAPQTTAEEDGQTPELDPSLVEAATLLQAGRGALAIPILERLLGDQPPPAIAMEAHFLLASALHASRQHERAKLEYDRHLRNHPDSPHYLDALIGKCRVEWESAPRSGPLPVRTGRTRWVPSFLATGASKALQKRLIAELEEAILRFPTDPHTADALLLVAEIAEPPRLSDYAHTVSALERLYEHKPATAAENLFHAAELCQRRLDDPARSLRLYKRFVADFPDHPRTADVREEIADLEQRLPTGDGGN